MEQNVRDGGSAVAIGSNIVLEFVEAIRLYCIEICQNDLENLSLSR